MCAWSETPGFRIPPWRWLAVYLPHCRDPLHGGTGMTEHILPRYPSAST
jgi:hypothetical protein